MGPVNPGGRAARDLEATDSGRALIRAVLPAWEGAQGRARRVLGVAVTEGILEAVNAVGEACAS